MGKRWAWLDLIQRALSAGCFIVLPLLTFTLIGVVKRTTQNKRNKIIQGTHLEKTLDLRSFNPFNTLVIAFSSHTVAQFGFSKQESKQYQRPTPLAFVCHSIYYPFTWLGNEVSSLFFPPLWSIYFYIQLALCWMQWIDTGDRFIGKNLLCHVFDLLWVKAFFVCVR